MLVGKIQIQDWFGNGIKRAALMNKWVLKEVNIDEDERCLLQTDGSFLYLLCKDGLYKVGSGYSGTVRVRIPFYLPDCTINILEVNFTKHFFFD